MYFVGLNKYENRAVPRMGLPFVPTLLGSITYILLLIVCLLVYFSCLFVFVVFVVFCIFVIYGN